MTLNELAILIENTNRHFKTRIINGTLQIWCEIERMPLRRDQIRQLLRTSKEVPHTQYTYKHYSNGTTVITPK